MEKVIGIYKVFFKDKNGAMRVSLVNDPAEIKPPNKIIRIEKNRPGGCFKCC